MTIVTEPRRGHTMTNARWVVQLVLLAASGCAPGAPRVIEADAGAAKCVGLSESACKATAGCHPLSGMRADAALCANSRSSGNGPVFLGCDAEEFCGLLVGCTADPVTGVHYATPTTCVPPGWTLEGFFSESSPCCAGSAGDLVDAMGTPDTATAGDLAAADTASASDVMAVDIGTQATSTDQACVCWPKGDGCNLPGVAYIPSDPAKACPSDEVCDGDATDYYPGPFVFGHCHKLCVFAGAKVQGTMGCSAQEKCAIIVIKDGYSDTPVAMCVPAQGALGSDQTGQPSPPKKRSSP